MCLAKNEVEYFTCDNCGRTYKKERSDEEALKEAKEIFGDVINDIKNLAVVCDDCYRGLFN
jgi:protein involved in sex pheromone biosynthesis